MSSKPRNFSQALEELENLSSSTATELKNRLQTEFKRLEDQIDEIKPHLEDLKDKVQSEALAAKNKVEKKVKANPWTTIGIVGLVAFLLGAILAGLSVRERD